MFARLGGYALLVVRASLVGGGLAVAGLAGLTLATAPGGAAATGFVSGAALLVWGTLAVFGLGGAGLGVALPALLGRADGLGFSHGQRRLLQGGGLLALGGVAGFLAAVSSNAFGWMVGGLLVVLCGVTAVLVGLAWRAGAAIERRLAG
jgi:hypothetical protein